MAQSIKQVGINPIPRTVNVKRPRLVGHAYNPRAGETEMASLRGLTGSLAHSELQDRERPCLRKGTVRQEWLGSAVAQQTQLWQAKSGGSEI